MNRSHIKKTILILAFAAFFIFETTADTTDSIEKLIEWLDTDERGERYLPIEALIVEQAQHAKEHGVPLGPIIEKVKEGAGKGIDPERLLAAIVRLVDTMETARETIAAFISPVPDDLIRDVTLFIEGGLAADTVITPLIELSLVRKKNIEPFRAACGVLLQIRALHCDDQKLLASLGASLVSSKLPLPGYTSIYTLFIKARAGRMGDAEIITMIVSILDSGGGIIQIEQELRRRLKNR